MNEAPDEQRNSTTDATSSGLPCRFSSGVLSIMNDIIGWLSNSC